MRFHFITEVLINVVVPCVVNGKLKKKLPFPFFFSLRSTKHRCEVFSYIRDTAMIPSTHHPSRRTEMTPMRRTTYLLSVAKLPSKRNLMPTDLTMVARTTLQLLRRMELGFRRGCGPRRFDTSPTRSREIGVSLAGQIWWIENLAKIFTGGV